MLKCSDLQTSISSDVQTSQLLIPRSTVALRALTDHTDGELHSPENLFMSDLPNSKEAAAADPDLSGQKLGNYQLLRRLGRGGMADVYLAEQLSLSGKSRSRC